MPKSGKHVLQNDQHLDCRCQKASKKWQNDQHVDCRCRKVVKRSPRMTNISTADAKRSSGMTNMSTAGAKNVTKTCQIIHSDMRSRELVFHPQENARPGDHSQLYPFDSFQSNGPIISAMLSMRSSGYPDLQFCHILCGFRQFNN